jgi:hypothetical protein
MSAESKVTTDHRRIKQWVEERRGKPARVKGSVSGSGLLGIDYPGYAGENILEPIAWEEFFEGFEAKNLAFLYQEVTNDGVKSRFAILIERDSAKYQATS